MDNFASLIDQFLQESFEDSPVTATSLGADGFDDKLPELSAAAFQRRNEWVDAWESKLSAVADDGLALDEQIDRDLVLSSLKGSQVMRDWQAYKRDPAIYLGPGLSGVFSLFLHRVHPEGELAAAAAARLAQVPQLIEDGKKNLDASLASPLIVERAKGQCAAGIAYFRKLVPQEVAGEDDRQKLTEAGEIAARAYEDFAKFLDAFASDASGDWAIGETRYSALLQEKEKLGYGADDMLEKGKAAYAELDEQMSRFGKDNLGNADWRTLILDLNKDHPSTPEEMRVAYEEWTERARQFLIDNDLVTLPAGEKCLVVPSPHFQRPVLAVASYNPPPAFKPSLTGYFFVPFPPEGTSEEEVQKRLESNARHSIPTTAIHEAYPGHHWHLVKMQENPSKIRKVIWTSYFVEGWALYTEKMMREEGVYDDPRDEINYFDARIFRAARIVVDTSLHTGKMSFDEAVEFMMKNANLSEPTAKAEVGRYCSWPTQAPSYLTGSIEIERMRDDWFAKKMGSLKQFHDKIATSGGLPIGLAERALMAP